ncbi:uncharacterized protein LOC123880109 isoform X2 [Maniola jurtina]|nr:uncharacterized protein LOC123880109 isoform X2 [Maniola jurtina]
MNSNIQPPRRRGHRRRDFQTSQRVRPYRMANLDTPSNIPSRHCNRPNLNQESDSRHAQEESSFRSQTKRSGGNRHGDDNDMPDDAERELLVRGNSPHSSRSFETLTPELLQLGAPIGLSSPIQSSSRVSRINKRSANEVEIEQQRKLPQHFIIRLDNVWEEPFEVNPKRISPSHERNILKPLLNFDDSFFSPPRMVPEFPTPSASARKLANNLIKLSRYLRAPNLTKLGCLDCGGIPVLPVTGQCGHTRCMGCIMDNGACLCNMAAPEELHVNTVVRHIIDRMMTYITRSRSIISGSTEMDDHTVPQLGAELSHLVKRRSNRSLNTPMVNSTYCLGRPRMPMTIQARYRRARHLLDVGKYLEAAPHLARVGASSGPIARNARILLQQTINAIWCRHRQSSISHSLRQSVREQAAYDWLKPADLECVLCTDTFSNPVCTPCGHTYCRECIERCMLFQKKCALCLGSLKNFNPDETRDTVFITSILSSIEVRDATDVIPIVTCHVAYPGMPCPLFFFNPRYCQMVQRVLASGSRRFGMLAYNFAEFGTVVEIRDCILFEDRRCIVSTVGVSRFTVVEKFIQDGCDVARIRRVSDAQFIQEDRLELQMLAIRIYRKSLIWLRRINVPTETVLEEIETAFGSLPDNMNLEDLETPDGPFWLWWLVAVLPLHREIKFLILQTRSLLKRMLAVSRALERLDFDSRPLRPEAIVNSEEWLQSIGQ